MWTNTITQFRNMFDSDLNTSPSFDEIDDQWLMVSLGASYKVKHFTIVNAGRSKNFLFKIYIINQV